MSILAMKESMKCSVKPPELLHVAGTENENTKEFLVTNI